VKDRRREIILKPHEFSGPNLALVCDEQTI